MSPKNADKVRTIYQQVCPENLVDSVLLVLDTPLTRDFYYSKKLNALLDIDVKVFNKAVYEYLKTTDLPVGQLDEFPLIDNDDILVRMTFSPFWKIQELVYLHTISLSNLK